MLVDHSIVVAAISYVAVCLLVLARLTVDVFNTWFSALNFCVCGFYRLTVLFVAEM